MSRRLVQNYEQIGEGEDWARPLVKENLSERAYSDLKNALMHGKLKPGEQNGFLCFDGGTGHSASPRAFKCSPSFSARAVSVRVGLIAPRFGKTALETT